jgi:hypothetical protein
MTDRLVAKGDVNVHVLLGPEKKGKPVDIKSQVLRPGDSVAYEDVPSYVKAAFEAGNIPLLELVSAEEAEERLETAEEEAALAESTFSSIVTEEPSDNPTPHEQSSVVPIGEGEVMFISGDNGPASLSAAQAVAG